MLGGDGTILRALQRYAGTDVPVFAINFGEIGFLATVEPRGARGGHAPRPARRLRAAAPARRSCSTACSPAEASARAAASERAQDVERPGLSGQAAVNDVAIHRKVGERVAELAYEIEGEEAGSVRCDGLVVATPAGSTGYNLANGGPVMAWGVEGFVVSFIAPHSMTRACAGGRARRPPDDPQPLARAARRRARRPSGRRDRGRGEIDARFVSDIGTIAQLPGSSFYRRLREKFGRLAS